MVLGELKENISLIRDGTDSYIEITEQYYKLSLFKVIMKSISSMLKAALVTFILLLALIILSFAASYGIGQLLNSIFYGFLSVGLFYGLMGVIIYIFRNKINKSLLKKYSEFYFEEI